MKSCLVKNCERECHGRQPYCKMHYGRWKRHGNPLTVLQAPKLEARALIERATLYESECCLIWPFAKTRAGYGAFTNKHGGKTSNAHHVVCERVYGPALIGFEAAHSCGNKLCINPRHLRWATRKENEADKQIHGTGAEGERHGRAKLTNKEVVLIRSLNGYQSSRAVAKNFDVEKSTILSIWNGRAWACLS